MIRREAGTFLMVGTLTVLIDYSVYRGLVDFLAVDVDLSKGIGFLSGTVFAYVANRFWTFQIKQQIPGSVWRFIVLYSSTLTANVAINSLILSSYGIDNMVIYIAFLSATGISATLNFVGMKFFVFRKS